MELKTNPFVVQLLPLDEAAVRIYAEAGGVEDAESFLAELENTHAWELARRPADVNDLLAYWRESGKLGTLTQILSFVCESQLKKTSDRERSEILSLERAQSGAKCLAAATILCRKFIFQIPGETNIGSQAIDALSSLPPDWKNEEVRALLNHALFDGASYGHIRFHHRRLSEFLAARWFEDLMGQGCPVGELETLLFDVRGSERVLRPSLAPLAAWLCAGAGRWNTMVCRRVIEVAPEILLRYGDPAMLTFDDRRALLKALLKKADGRQSLWWEHDQATLSRLSDEVLVPEINELLTDPSSGRTLRNIALEIVIAGRLVGCAKAVLQIAIADLATGEIFPTAVRALEIYDSETDLRALATASKTVEHFPERVCVPLCNLLFPKLWSVPDLFVALKKMNPVARSGIGWDFNLSQHLALVTSKENGVAILKGLLGHPIEEVVDEEDFEPPSSIRTALAVSNVMLGWQVLSEDEACAIAKVLVRVRDHRGYLSREEFVSEKTEPHLRVRELYFRLAAQQIAKEHDYKDVRISSIVIFHEMLKPIVDDLLWITQWLKNATSQSERQIALGWGLDLWQQLGRPRKGIILLKEAAKLFPDTRKQLWQNLHPGLIVRTKRFWYRHIRFRFRTYHWRLARRKIKEPFNKLRGTWNLWRYRDKLRSGEHAGWLAELASEAHDKSRSQWSPSDWSILEKKRGVKCAAAVKEGCKRIWERYSPPLPHEKKPNDGVTNGTLAGLAGIKVAWEEGQLCFSKLCENDAKRATRYAVCELNGFTPWFNELIREQPQAVRSVLEECISGEWNIPAGSEHYHLVIYDLASTESCACDLVKSSVFKHLGLSDPNNLGVLQCALRIIVKEPSVSREDIANLAKQKLTDVTTIAGSVSHWLAMWLQVDALPAMAKIELLFAEADNPTELTISLCSHLSGRYGHDLAVLQNPSWLNPEAMKKFIPFIYHYINQKEDIDRSKGGAYSPEPRDDAQEFRNGLLQMLVSTGNPEAMTVLQEFLLEPELSHITDYIRHLLEKHREQMAEGRAWRSSDIRAFGTDYEHDPQTDADLFRIGLRRLKDLKQWVEAGEDSPRNEVNIDNNEAGFRDWLRRRLNESAKGRFVVPPEWEIIGGRPDLRLVIPNAAPVSLELKIADNWTLQQLIDGLEEQLVGTYLRDHRARYGIYVLALFNRARKWHPLEAGPQIDCEEMLLILQNRIKTILENRPDISELNVILIHFSQPEK